MTRFWTLAIVTTSILIGAGAPSVFAVPVNGTYVDDARCDLVPNINLTHELGTTPPFPINESIVVSVSPFNNAAIPPPCVGDDGAPNDWVVRMTNASGASWQDLHLVVNQGFSVGNADGAIQDNATPGFTDAFRIDGTVTLGVNNVLIGESINANEIFEPGEIWDFIMMNFTGGVPSFDLIGFAASAPGGPPSTASILAIPVIPEPASLGLFAVGMMAALKRGCRRRSW